MEIMTDGTNTSQTVYIHGPNIDEPLAIERDGNYAYYHADGLGSVVSITDPSRNVLQTYTYDAFGSITPSTSFRNSFTYTGREYDEETGLYFYRARYYDPRLGRFLNVDPIGFEGGDTNLYAYVWNNPVNWIDPWGLFPSVLPKDTVDAAIGRAMGTGNTAELEFLLKHTCPSPKDIEKIRRVLEGVKQAQSWLGKDYKVITNKAGDKIFISKDGLRKMRFDINKPYPHKNSHSHIEELINGKWV
jgi:RHS repeat-associated protein